MRKHTPGPWVMSKNNGQWQISAESESGYCITAIPYDPEYGKPKEDEANARLIAAAPDLLKTLDLIKCFCETAEASHKDELFLRRLKEELAPIVSECDYAIAKAEGNSK